MSRQNQSFIITCQKELYLFNQSQFFSKMTESISCHLNFFITTDFETKVWLEVYALCVNREYTLFCDF